MTYAVIISVWLIDACIVYHVLEIIYSILFNASYMYDFTMKRTHVI